VKKLSNEDKGNIKEYFKNHNSRYKIYRLLAKKHSCTLNLIKRTIDKGFDEYLRKISRINYLKKCYIKKKESLNSQQRKLMEMRLFNKMLLHDIGKANGFSRERARQIIAKSINIISNKPNKNRYNVV